MSLNANSADVAFTFKGGMLPMTVVGRRGRALGVIYSACAVVDLASTPASRSST